MAFSGKDSASMVTCRIPQNVVQNLKAISQRKWISRSAVARMAMELGLAKMEHDFNSNHGHEETEPEPIS